MTCSSPEITPKGEFLGTTVELAAHMDPGGVNPNYESTNSDSPDDEDAGLDPGIYQAGQSKQKSRTESVVHVSWDVSWDCKMPTLKPLPNICVVYLSLKVGPRWMLGLRLSIMSRSLPSLQMVLRNERPVLTPWNQLLQVLFCWEKGSTQKMT